MDKRTAIEIREEINSFIGYLATEYGLFPKVSNGTLGDDYLTLTVRMEQPVEVDRPQTVIKRDPETGKASIVTLDGVRMMVPSSFLRDGAKFCIDERDFHRKLTIHGEDYLVTGINSRAKKLPVVIERVSDGEEFKTTVRMVLAARQMD